MKNSLDPNQKILDMISPTFSRADFKIEIFDNLIKQKGYSVIWEQGMFCSCIQEQDGQPDYMCPICKGKGYIYFNPKNTKAVVTSISGRKEQERIGLNDVGTAYLTPLSTDLVGFRDRFTFKDFTIKYSEVLNYGEELRYPVIDIISVRQGNKTFIHGIDFDLSQDNRHIIWKPNKVTPNSRYSILYTTHPVYIAINPIHELRGTYTMMKGQGLEYFVPLPSQYQIKREDFLGASSDE